METVQVCKLTDQQKAADMLATEKYMTCMYNDFCCEAATPSVKSSLCSLLQDEHSLQNELFTEMSSRGWYQVEKAEDNKVSNAKMKFGKNAKV